MKHRSRNGMWYSAVLAAATVAAAGMLSGCSARNTVSAETVVPVYQDYGQAEPGVAEYVWEEPMVDVVEVPPGLDPEGIYYRPAHREVVEIRQGRYRYYRPEKR